VFKYEVVVRPAWLGMNGDDRLLVAKRLNGNHCHERGSDRHAFPSQILGTAWADRAINCHDPNSVTCITSFVLGSFKGCSLFVFFSWTKHDNDRLASATAINVAEHVSIQPPAYFQNIGASTASASCIALPHDIEGF
jgi:hypothetical protein